jgi:uncharacterized protein YhjY with autotransporter beta-barrel domain
MSRRGESDDFECLLGAALDPGEIEFDAARREDLVARLSGIAKEEDLTAWALGELPEERRMPLEVRMDGDPALRVEGLAIRNFCHRAELLLPPVAAPGWWERRRLRRVFSAPAPRRQVAGLVAAAAAAVVLSFAWFQRPAEPLLPAVAGAGIAAGDPLVEAVRSEVPVVAVVPADPSEVGAVARVADIVSAARPAPRRNRVEEKPARLAMAEVPVEAAFEFSEAPRRPGLPMAHSPTADPDELLAVNVKLRGDAPMIHRRTLVRTEAPSGSLLASLDGGGPIQSPRLTGGSRDLVSGAISIARMGEMNSEPDADQSAELGEALPAATPETGPLILAQSQPYLLSALLRGPVSGRPDLNRTGGGAWLSADLQVMDFNLPSGKGGVESDSWRIEAGMSWQFSPSWQAGVSLAGIDSRMEVPGFGSVDAEGAAFSWSLDWREKGYHAALTHTLGTFDQDLRRQAGGMLHPASQDATVQLLSLWMTREFEAGCWTHGPVAGVEGSWGSLEGYQERFAGGVGVAGRDFGLVTSLVGWQVAGRIDTAAGDWLPHAVLGWRHRSVLADAGMAQGGPAGNFVVPPVSPERDSLLLEGGLRWVPPGGALFFHAVSSTEWRNGGDSENSLLFKLGYQF